LTEGGHDNFTIALSKNILRALQSAREQLLPWRGRDVQTWCCGLSEKNPVFADGTTHSAMGRVARVVESLVTRASGHMPHSELWLEWCLLALDLVDLVNATTDFDEVGFSPLLHLCQTLRGPLTARETDMVKLTYLSDTKLSRISLCGDSLCLQCLAKLPGPGAKCSCAVRRVTHHGL